MIASQAHIPMISFTLSLVVTVHSNFHTLRVLLCWICSWSHNTLQMFTTVLYRPQGSSQVKGYFREDSVTSVLLCVQPQNAHQILLLMRISGINP